MIADTHIPGGYLLLPRQLMDSGLMSMSPLAVKLFIWMLLKANFRDRDKLKRGQFVTSTEELQAVGSYSIGYRTVKPSKGQVRSSYEALVKAALITTSKTTRGMIITVLNYNKYQDFSRYEAHSEAHNENFAKPSMTTHDTEVIESSEARIELPSNEGSRRQPQADDPGGGVLRQKETGGVPPCPHQKTIELYHEILPELPKVREWTGARKAALQGRWREKGNARSNLGWWKDYFLSVRDCPFLLGKVPGRDGKKPFTADLEWLTKPSNFVKVIEGRYLERKDEKYGRFAGAI